MGQVGRALVTATRDRRIGKYGTRLADEGWHEEISSHRKDCIASLIGVEGAQVPASVTEGGTSAHILTEYGI